MQFRLLQDHSQDADVPLTIKTDLSDMDSEESEFIRCVPSPHTNSFNHLRRNSMTGYNGGGGGGGGTLVQGRAVVSAGLQLDNNRGSAKKVCRILSTGVPLETIVGQNIVSEISMSQIIVSKISIK